MEKAGGQRPQANSCNHLSITCLWHAWSTRKQSYNTFRYSRVCTWTFQFATSTAHLSRHFLYFKSVHSAAVAVCFFRGSRPKALKQRNFGLSTDIETYVKLQFAICYVSLFSSFFTSQPPNIHIYLTQYVHLLGGCPSHDHASILHWTLPYANICWRVRCTQLWIANLLRNLNEPPSLSPSQKTHIEGKHKTIPCQMATSAFHEGTAIPASGFTSLK